MSKKNIELPPGAVDVAGLGAPSQPQVNLLPPEIRAKRSLGRIKAWLAVLLLAVLALAAAGVVWAMFEEQAAEEELREKETEIVRLQEEQARYSEVPRIKGQITDTRAALETTMAAEVLWTDFLGAIQATLPENVRIESLNTSLPGPNRAETPSGNPLDPPSVGSVSFSGRASVLPDMAQWMDNLMTIPGVVGVTFDSADVREDDGVVAYTISVRIEVDSAAYAHQYIESEEVD